MVVSGDVTEGDVHLAVGADEIGPNLLGLTAGVPGRSHDSPFTVRLDSEESTTCISSDVGWQNLQERGCG